MSCRDDVTCDAAFWRLMIIHHQVGIDMIHAYTNSALDPTFQVFLRTIASALDANGARMLSWLRGSTAVMGYRNHSLEKPAICRPTTSLDYYAATNPCRPHATMETCNIPCREIDLLMMRVRKHWPCAKAFIEDMVTHHDMGVAICTAKQSHGILDPLTQTQIWTTIQFMKKNVVDMVAFLENACAYQFISPLLYGRGNEAFARLPVTKRLT
jgi:uncharacterized protein (DUF305 family)